eukprot:IDg12000t1
MANSRRKNGDTTRLIGEDERKMFKRSKDIMSSVPALALFFSGITDCNDGDTLAVSSSVKVSLLDLLLSSLSGDARLILVPAPSKREYAVGREWEFSE